MHNTRLYHQKYFVLHACQRTNIHFEPLVPELKDFLGQATKTPWSGSGADRGFQSGGGRDILGTKKIKIGTKISRAKNFRPPLRVIQTKNVPTFFNTFVLIYHLLLVENIEEVLHKSSLLNITDLDNK